jgi:hypothetical protein
MVHVTSNIAIGIIDLYGAKKTFITAYVE